MLPWLNNPHASYVLIAYAVTALALGGLALASWRDWKNTKAQEHKLRPRPLQGDPQS